MSKNRLEAFSDGVLAIAITIMVLELKAPQEGQSIRPALSTFTSYVLSFLYVGIYWNNHHNMFQATHRVRGTVLWANLHLLFWLSLIPFVTAWMGNTHFASYPVAAYGVVLLASAGAWTLLAWSLRKAHDPEDGLSKALGQTGKEVESVCLYLAGIACAFWHPWLSCLLYTVVAFIWFVPDQRLEKAVKEEETTHHDTTH